jgi:hypothetical protein
MRLTAGVFPAVIVLSTLSSSCWFQKKPAAFTPPPPQAQPKVASDPVTLPQPPQIAADPKANLPPSAPDSVPDPLPPADRNVPARRPPASTPVHTTPPPASAEAPAPPRLGPVFTADQRREYTRSLEESLERVRRALEFLATRNLNPEQRAARDKISTFQKQAEQAREQDLVLAVNLAKRADLLAQDLVARVRQ